MGASPQLEDGYTRIANELLDAIIATPLNDYERRVLLYVIRKTYGFGKPADRIPDSQIARAIGTNRQNVWRTIQKLKKRKILAVSTDCKLSVNKDYVEWLDCSLNRLHNHKVVAVCTDCTHAVCTDYKKCNFAVCTDALKRKIKERGKESPPTPGKNGSKKLSKSSIVKI